MKIQVLDHGYVEFVEAWGHGKAGIDKELDSLYLGYDHEAGIIEAARQSTQGSFRGWDQDQRLLSFLYKNNHATPFEFAGLVIEVQAPIFVFREWHRHRTQSYNEMSARYAPLPDLYYEPTISNIAVRSAEALQAKNKQTGSVATVEVESFHELAEEWKDELTLLYQKAEEVYQWGLSQGIPKELARLVMPVGHYSRMRASTNLRNWLVFCTLRMAPNAQWEIRQYANAVGEILKANFPRTWELFNANPREA